MFSCYKDTRVVFVALQVLTLAIRRHAGFDGYDKETGEAKGWSVARGADIWMLETCDSIKGKRRRTCKCVDSSEPFSSSLIIQVGTKAWNKKTSLWLLKYVYIRNRSRLGIVYAVSAIWHGFYPGTLID